MHVLLCWSLWAIQWDYSIAVAKDASISNAEEALNVLVLKDLKLKRWSENKVQLENLKE